MNTTFTQMPKSKRALSVLCACFAMAIGTTVLLGWHFQIAVLKS